MATACFAEQAIAIPCELGDAESVPFCYTAAKWVVAVVGFLYCWGVGLGVAGVA